MATSCGPRLVGDFSSFLARCRSILFRFLFSRCICARELGLYYLLVTLFEHRVYSVHVRDMTYVRPGDVQCSRLVVERT